MQIQPVPSSRSESPRRSRWTALAGAAVLTIAVALSGLVAAPPQAQAAEPPVGLGTAGSFSVLGGQAVTNTGPSVLDADLGVSPGTAITGFPPGIVGGAVHSADAPASQAQSDLVIAYNDAAGRTSTASVAGDLVGQTLVGGVYTASSSLAVSGTLTLDGQNDSNSVFIFQVGSTLTTASASSISLINNAQACNVYWQVGSSATLGTASSFVGTVMALTSITVTTGTVVEGRALARNGQVTLDTNTFTAPGCNITAPPTDTTTGATDTATTGTTVTSTDTTTTATTTTTTATATTTPPGTSITTTTPTGPSAPRLPDTGPGPFTDALIVAGSALVLLGTLALVVIRRPRARR